MNKVSVQFSPGCICKTVLLDLHLIFTKIIIDLIHIFILSVCGFTNSADFVFSLCNVRLVPTEQINVFLTELLETKS